jgi:4a-hydroxytetrahydrobiopterin dehydratase
VGLVSDLAASSCEACRIDAPLVSDDEASILINEIEGWDVIDDGVKKLKKEFSFSNYSDSVDFSNKVADIAEKEDHHPQIILEWGKVTVIWWSHKIKGLHKNDFICAAKTNSISKN